MTVMDWQHEPALAEVYAAQLAASQADRTLETAVSAARAAGHSWEQIGDALGTSRQAAWERFRRLEK